MIPILKDLIESVEVQLKRQKSEISFGELEVRLSLARKPFDFRQAFVSTQGHNIISEIKFASPSEGMIRDDLSPIEVASEYLSKGSKAISILTEESSFNGHINYIKQVREKFPFAKILRKDFIFDPYQILHARVMGADAVLLIAAMLPEGQLKELLAAAKMYGLTPLVEVHDEEEMEIVLKCGPELIGVNNRNLKTMEVDLETSKNLAKYKTENMTLISESGIKTFQDLEKLKSYGYDGFLVGTRLMRKPSPGLALQELLGGPR